MRPEIVQDAFVANAAARNAGGVLGPCAGTRDPGTAAAEFAGLFYSMMLSEMQKSVPQNPYFGTRGEETFRSLWINEMGRALAYRPDDVLSATIRAAIEENYEAEGLYAGEGGPL
ncbi:MAG: hypothetical protein ACYTAN_04760 [Planctomycetota bacterium]|jgi:hypothetical protein